MLNDVLVKAVKFIDCNLRKVARSQRRYEYMGIEMIYVLVNRTNNSVQMALTLLITKGQYARRLYVNMRYTYPYQSVWIWETPRPINTWRGGRNKVLTVHSVKISYMHNKVLTHCPTSSENSLLKFAYWGCNQVKHFLAPCPKAVISGAIKC